MTYEAWRISYQSSEQAARAAYAECDALRVKIAEMERQEPVEWQARTRPTWNDGTWGQWSKCSEGHAQDIKKTPLLHDWLYEARALYALPGAQNVPKAVAYLDIGAGGYMDIGTDLTVEELATLPKGRHMLGIVGMYGVDGYLPAHPAPSAPDGVVEALQRLIENGAVLGPASSEDALLVARYRQRLLACAPSVPTALLVAAADLVAQMEIVSRVGFVDTPNDKDSCAAFCVAEGTWLELMSAVESLASALAAAPEAKP